MCGGRKCLDLGVGLKLSQTVFSVANILTFQKEICGRNTLNYD